MPRRLAAAFAAGALAALLFACGYSDPYQSSRPVAGTETLVPSPSPGADSFNDGAGRTPVKLPDGLAYIDLTVGAGAVVKSGDHVFVQYTGWLTNGTKFDSSRDRGTPFDFTVGAPNSVIQGWTEGIPGMRVGGKRKLIIPPALGYGSQGSPPTIPANATLVFDVEIVSIGPAPSPTPSVQPSPSPGASAATPSPKTSP